MDIVSVDMQPCMDAIVPQLSSICANFPSMVSYLHSLPLPNVSYRFGYLSLIIFISDAEVSLRVLI